MRTRLKLDLWLLIGVIFFTQLTMAMNQDLPDPDAKKTNLVEIEYAPSTDLSYLERRPDYSWVFGYKLENYYPVGHRSAASDSKEKYEEIYGNQPIQMHEFTAGLKWNLQVVSIGLEGVYGRGGITRSHSGTSYSSQLTKMGAAASLYFDAFWLEPYVVPYVTGEAYQVDYVDTRGATIASGASGPIIGGAAGLLFQLNWLERDVARRSLAQEGLSNAYLNVFVSQSEDSGSQDFSKEIWWGAGAVLEF